VPVPLFPPSGVAGGWGDSGQLCVCYVCVCNVCVYVCVTCLCVCAFMRACVRVCVYVCLPSAGRGRGASTSQ
jgi:hypothetical protein